MSDIANEIEAARLRALIGNGGVPVAAPVQQGVQPAFRVWFHGQTSFAVGGAEMLPAGIEISGAEEIHSFCFDTPDENGKPEKHIFWFDKAVHRVLLAKMVERLSEEDARELARSLSAALADPPAPVADEPSAE